MGYFSEYIKSVLTIGICAFLCQSAGTVSKNNASLSKALRLTVNLCVFLVVISPIFSFFGNIDFDNLNFTKSEIITEDSNAFESLTEAEIEKNIYTNIYDNLKINIENIKADIEMNGNSITIKQISATASDSKDAETVTTYIKETFGQEIYTEITVKNNEDH